MHTPAGTHNSVRPSSRRLPTGEPAARRGRRHLRDPRSIGLNVVPLVDVTFLLMIFFVIAGTFEAGEGVLSSQMLATGSGPGVPLPISPIVVRLTKAGLTVDDFTIRIDRPAITALTFADLADHLARIRGQGGFDGETPVIIYADDEVGWQHVVNGWNAAARAGFANLAFGRPPQR